MIKVKPNCKVDTYKLKQLLQEFGLQDWQVRIQLGFTFKVDNVNCRKKMINLYPCNFWAGLMAKIRRQKKANHWPIMLAHEFRHCLQDSKKGFFHLSTYLLYHFYWFAPTEIDARKRAKENWQKFEGILLPYDS